MIERVAELLSDPRLHLDADDIADALWLALQIEAMAPAQGASEQPAPADDDDDTDPEPPPKPPDTQTDTKTTSPQEKERGNLYPSPGQQQGDDPDDMRGVPFRTPAASALPAAREIAKALRPLMCRYPSRTQAIFDEQATVQKIADERIAWIGGRRSRVSGLWHIQLQPARERWFDVELVADVGASMVLWRQSIAEFHHLLLRHGAFRRVRAWSLNTDSEEGSPGLYPGLGDPATRQPPRSRQELLAPGGRRLILIVTDCVSPGWHAGVMTDLLAFWGTHHPIALVQVLPERLWSGSALRATSAIQMQSSGPDTANRRLTYTFQSPMDRLLLRRRTPTQPTTRLPVPVLTLDGDQVAAWASLVTGTGTTPTSGFLLTSTPDASMPIPDEDEQPADDLAPEQRVDDFREYASPEAFRLAQFLAAAPLSLPVIRLVQRTMMPKARQGHIAEVFLSGLLRRRTPAEADVHPEYVWYDFLAGVREVLRQGLSLYEDALVMERVTEYVRDHYGTPQDFQALLFDPDAVDGVALDPHMQPFAEVVAGLQERMGVRNEQYVIQSIEAGEIYNTFVAGRHISDIPVIHILKGHTGTVRDVAFAPDGQMLASASGDGTVRLWRVSDGTLLHTLLKHTKPVWSVNFTPDGEVLVSGSVDKTVLLWRAFDGTLLRTLEGHTDSVREVVISPDGQILASASEDRTVRLWHVSDGTLFRTLSGHTNRIYSVAFSPDGQILASGSKDRTVRLWRVFDGALLRTFEGHTDRIWSVAFSPDGQLIASASEDRSVKVWRVPDGAALWTLSGHTNRIYSVAFSPDGQMLASASYDRTVCLWQVSTGVALHVLRGHSRDVGGVTFSPDGRILASASYDQTLRLWYIENRDSEPGVYRYRPL